MSDTNVTVMSGRVTRDCELRYTQNSNAVASLSIACNRKSGDQEKTVYMDIKIWGKRAETLSEYLKKGRYIVVTGPIEEDSWDDSNGNKRTKKILVAETINLVPRGESTQDAKSPYNTQEDIPSGLVPDDRGEF
jgi:single-strand DNA-binding protein